MKLNLGTLCVVLSASHEFSSSMRIILRRDVPSQSSLLSDLGGLILEVFLTEPFSIRMGSRGCQTVEEIYIYDILREDSGEKETSYDL